MSRYNFKCIQMSDNYGLIIFQSHSLICLFLIKTNLVTPLVLPIAADIICQNPRHLHVTAPEQHRTNRVRYDRVV